MTERRPRSGRMVGMAEGVAAAVRRRQRDREPRVLVFDPAGAPHLIAPSAPGYDSMLEAAEGMLELTGGRSRDPRPRSSANAGRVAGSADEPAA